MKSLLILFILITSAFSQIFISEIERNPQGPETEIPGGKSHEYIELVNLSEDTIAIASLAIFDGAMRDQLIPKRGGSLFRPGTVLIILDPDYFPVESLYPIGIDPSALIATVSHSSMCGGLTGTDGFLVEQNGKVLASCSDSINEDGKILFDSFSGTENESSVLAPNHLFGNKIWSEQAGSPGTVRGLNGSIIYEYEISPEKISFVYRSFGANGSVNVIANDLLICSFAVSNSLNRDSVSLPDELKTLCIESSDGVSTFKETIDLSRIRLPAGAVKISEISPRSEIEWFELHNETPSPINLTGWKLFNESYTVFFPAVVISADEYLVFSDKEFSYPEKSIPFSFFSLDNYRDTLRLDSHLGAMDSVLWDYSSLPKWTTETLHRTAVSNGFGTKSLMLGTPTPGSASSLSPDNTPLSVKVKPELFTPNGDGKDDSLQIDITAPSGYSCRLRLFDSSGKELRRFESAKARTFWNGGTDSGLTVRRGPIIVLAEFESESGRQESRRVGAVLWR